ncbi:hypothetical protein Aph01nite_65720 [Acrocarpospora phusangensis]|uniref:Uncharacterized protein n=1 Tax=Acrocarpospora phusangensis TaxID=1070424 RepID=A0A919URP0_9ACTN|nr:hypothetical protein Aph01nite_65720 [Acrocarpospora phusangensis]
MGGRNARRQRRAGAHLLDEGDPDKPRQRSARMTPQPKDRIVSPISIQEGAQKLIREHGTGPVPLVVA